MARAPKSLRETLALEASRRCGYCLAPEWSLSSLLEVDHLMPSALGGATVRRNLWLACSLCNGVRGVRTEWVDPKRGDLVKLFNPRRQKWPAHFRWSEDGRTIIGRTAVGRATVQALDLNRDIRIEARELWIRAGIHPPKN